MVSRLIFLILAFFGSTPLHAEDPNAAEKARLRLYDGGMDEQPLQVQANLYNPKAENEKTGEGEIATAPTRGNQPPNEGPIDE